MNDSDLPLSARIAAAHARGEHEDVPEEAFIHVPEGVLQHKNNPDAPIEEKPVDAFKIATFLVTVGAYREFIEEGGYDDPSWWTDAGWSWRLDEAMEAPRFWDDPAWADYLISTHPVVGVSWFEADAYATFRQARLPTQLEWERAARGDDSRDFPWGSQWLDDACSSREYGPRGTVPVGVFPKGVSPLGVNDMVGSVWQWTSDPVVDSSENPAMVACGGAWNNKRWSIGCCRRNAYPRTAQFSNLGFRLASNA